MEDPFQALCHDLIDLIVNIGLINAVLPTMDIPEEVSENWQQRLEIISAFASDQIAEIQEFGSAFDGGDQSE